ncbi:unnamed protein product, partial [Nesidiocoris tenuis]
MKDTKIVAKIAFACVQFKDGQLSLNDNGDVKAKDLYSIKAGNPFKGFLNMSEKISWSEKSCSATKQCDSKVHRGKLYRRVCSGSR